MLVMRRPLVEELCLEDIRFSPSSFCSSVGRLFEWQGEIYRAISPERSSFFEQLFHDGVIDHLIKAGFLVESKPVRARLAGYGLVVHHRRLPIVSYPFEWCDQALKDAALFFLNLNLTLVQFGLMAHDVHPWNILFEGPRPVFVDLGSIKPLEKVDINKWIEEFHRFYLRPLHLFASEQRRLARLCLQDWREWHGGVLQEDFIRLTERDLDRRFLSKQVERVRRVVPAQLQRALRPLRSSLRKHGTSRTVAVSAQDDAGSRTSALNCLIGEIEAIGLPEALHWDYYRDLFAFPSFEDSSAWSPKHRNVASILEAKKPSSVIDIGSNRGWYAQLAARRGANVVAMDMDERLVSILYQDTKSNKLPVHPLVMNFLWPSPGFGLLDFWPSAVNRLRGEMVMALALVHHLVHKEGMQFDHIVDGFTKFTTRWLLTEFIPYDDPHLSTWDVKHLDWYCLDNFLGALRREYNLIQVMDSDPAPRVLIFCERKRS